VNQPPIHQDNLRITQLQTPVLFQRISHLVNHHVNHLHSHHESLHANLLYNLRTGRQVNLLPCPL
jgi:hypothetical protein